MVIEKVLVGCHHVGVQGAAGQMWSGYSGSMKSTTRCGAGGRIVAMSEQKARKVQPAEKLLHEFRQRWATPLPLLQRVAEDLVQEMHAGLAREDGSDQLKMLPTVVQNLPSGLGRTQ